MLRRLGFCFCEADVKKGRVIFLFQLRGIYKIECKHTKEDKKSIRRDHLQKREKSLFKMFSQEGKIINCTKEIEFLKMKILKENVFFEFLSSSVSCIFK